MPAIAHVDLEITAYGLTGTANTTAGTSAELPNGSPCLIIGSGQSRGNGAGVDSEANLLIGATPGARTVFARMADATTGFTVSGTLSHDGNGAQTAFGCSTLYTPGAGEEMEIQAWSDDGTGEGQWRIYALDLSNIVDDADDPGNGQRYHQVGTNSDAAVSTPTAAGDTPGTFTFTPNNEGDHWIVVSCEAFDAGGGTAAEIRVGLELDSVALSGTTVEVDSTPGISYGFIRMARVNLTAASHTIDIVADGSAAGGNSDLAFRRMSFHVIEVAAFEDADVQADSDVGETVVGVTDQTVGDIEITINPPATNDYLLFYAGGKQVSAWAEAFFLIDGTTEQPTNGFGNAVRNIGLAAGDDLIFDTGLHIEAGVSASTTVEVRLSKTFGGGGSTNNYGGDAARANAGNLNLLAIRLATPDPSTAHAGSGSVDGIGVIQGDGVASTPHAGSGSVSGVGTIQGDGTVATSHAGSGSVAGVGVFTATPSLSLFGAGILSGVGAIVGIGTRANVGAGSVDGTGIVQGDGSRANVGSGSITGVGTVQGAGTTSGSQPGSGTVSGIGLIQGDGSRANVGAGSVVGVGGPEGDGSRINVGSGAVSGLGTIQGNGTIIGTGTAHAGSGSLVGVGLVQGDGSRANVGSAVLQGVGLITGISALGLAGSATVAGTGGIQGNGTTPGSSLVLSPALGHTGGRTMVEITGTGFRLPTEATPNPSGTTAASPPSVAVYFGTEPARKVQVISETRIFAVTPEHDEGDVEVTVQNIDDNGDDIPGETFSTPAGFSFRLPQLHVESELVTLIRSLLQSLKRQIHPNVQLTVHTDFDDITEDALSIIKVASVPALVIRGPSLIENRFYTVNQRSTITSESSPDEYFTQRSLDTVDVVFDLLALSNRKIEHANLMSAVVAYFRKNKTLLQPSTGREVELDFVPSGRPQTIPRSNNDNLRTFRGSFLIRGFDLGEFPGFTRDQVETATRTTLDDETFLDLQASTNTGQTYPVGAHVSLPASSPAETRQEQTGETFPTPQPGPRGRS